MTRLYLSRRQLLRSAPLGAASLLAMQSAGHAWAQDRPAAAADYSIRIAPISLEIAPGKIIKTTAYNGTVPGPVLRPGRNELTVLELHASATREVRLRDTPDLGATEE